MASLLRYPVAYVTMLRLGFSCYWSKSQLYVQVYTYARDSYVRIGETIVLMMVTSLSMLCSLYLSMSGYCRYFAVFSHRLRLFQMSSECQSFVDSNTEIFYLWSPGYGSVFDVDDQ